MSMRKLLPSLDYKSFQCLQSQHDLSMKCWNLKLLQYLIIAKCPPNRFNRIFTKQKTKQTKRITCAQKPILFLPVQFNSKNVAIFFSNKKLKLKCYIFSWLTKVSTDISYSYHLQKVSNENDVMSPSSQRFGNKSTKKKRERGREKRKEKMHHWC